MVYTCIHWCVYRRSIMSKKLRCSVHVYTYRYTQRYVHTKKGAYRSCYNNQSVDNVRFAEQDHSISVLYSGNLFSFFFLDFWICFKGKLCVCYTVGFNNCRLNFCVCFKELETYLKKHLFCLCKESVSRKEKKNKVHSFNGIIGEKKNIFPMKCSFVRIWTVRCVVRNIGYHFTEEKEKQQTNWAELSQYN